MVGAFAGNPTTTVLWRALLVMAACWLIGRVVGAISASAVREHLEQYQEQNPIPDDTAPADQATDADAEQTDASRSAEGAQPASSS